MLDLITSFRFNVVFQLFGQTFPVGVSEINGLSVRVATEPVKEGGQNEYIQKLPSYPEYDNLVLKKATDIDLALYKWLKASVTTANFSPVPLTITMLGQDQQPVLAW